MLEKMIRGCFTGDAKQAAAHHLRWVEANPEEAAQDYREWLYAIAYGGAESPATEADEARRRLREVSEWVRCEIPQELSDTLTGQKDSLESEVRKLSLILYRMESEGKIDGETWATIDPLLLYLEEAPDRIRDAIQVMLDDIDQTVGDIVGDTL